ncbi:hypothetical protein QYE76_019885 [Lolium multiflorum]|uniref:Uncharacterized protein n=1 Tax=Lolium multiflorum TaxID=4521 RepID=A0AAD8R7S7_LOLMU|nr:hypothetical protein QYE76_019885 [Lolium multiflorum]
MLSPSTASPIDAGAGSGYHLLAVEGYSRNRDALPNGEHVRCRTFLVGGHRWYLKYYPNGYDSSCAGYISVSLALEEADGGYAPAARPVKAQVAFSFIDQTQLQVTAKIRGTRIKDFSLNPEHCYAEAVRRDILERSKHLKDDSFTIRCDVLVFAEEGARRATFTAALPPDMQSHFSDLLLTEEGADVMFEVGGGGDKFPAHQCMLAARSDVFKALLVGDKNNRPSAPGTVVKIDDIQAKVFSGLLAFIYTDAFPDWHMGSLEKDRAAEGETESGEDGREVSDEYVMWLLHLFEAADRYELPRLKSICEEMLVSRYIRVTTVADIVVVAEKIGSGWMKEVCLEFIRAHTSLHAVFSVDGFEQMIRECTPSGLKELISKFAA